MTMINIIEYVQDLKAMVYHDPTGSQEWKRELIDEIELIEKSMLYKK